MIQNGLSFLDVIVSTVLVFIIFGVASFFRPSKNSFIAKYYFKFITFKILTSILFVILHVFYFKGGDTFYYFLGAEFFSDQFISDPLNAINLIFSTKDNLGSFNYHPLFYTMVSSSADVYFFSKIVGLFSLFTFQQYLACSILFTLVTAIGIWKLFVVMCKLYPNMHKYFAIGILFYPSLGIWGSGILKDPLTFCCVGLIFTSIYSIINGKKYLSSIILISVSSYLCFVLKPYILYTFVPIMLLWTQGQISGKLKNPFLKTIITPVIIVLFSLGGYLAIDSISSGAGKYSLDSVQSVAEGFHSWHSYLAETRDQSGYSLGKVEFSPLGILRKAPEAFFVTYFRPFIIGDVRNIATLFEAVQALILLLLSVYVVIKVGVLNFLKLCITNVNLRSFLLFAIIFGVTVGITSYNFGALSRYKIPSVPFYTASIAIIFYLGYLKPKKNWD